MKKPAIAAALAATMATPAMAQYVYAPQPVARAYVQAPAIGPFGYAYNAPIGTQMYAFDPDPNVQLQERRNELLLGTNEH